MTTTLDHARRYLALGLSVIPVPRPQPGVAAGAVGDGKVPAIAWRAFQTRRSTDAELEEWFGGEPMNIAVVTGALSGVVVVDADSATAVKWVTTHLVYTPWQSKTAKGFHLWYRHPDVHMANRSRVETRDGRLAIDVRGDGGYVIAPGSVHASGAVYLEAGDWTKDASEVPVFWPGWLQRPTRSLPAAVRPTTSARQTGDVTERARRYLRKVPPPVIGAGSDAATLYAACRLVRGFDLDAATATSLLWEWAGGRPGWTYDWVAAKVAHATRYGSEPIGALR